MKKKLGLIVNPIAGMGGKVGLKGSDGVDILREAMKRGAKPESPLRASMALSRIIGIKDKIDILTFPYKIGRASCRERV